MKKYLLNGLKYILKICLFFRKQLCQIIKSRDSRGLTLEDIFCLLLYVYCLAGSDISFSETQENELSECLTSALSDWSGMIFVNHCFSFKSI